MYQKKNEENASERFGCLLILLQETGPDREGGTGVNKGAAEFRSIEGWSRKPNAANHSQSRDTEFLRKTFDSRISVRACQYEIGKSINAVMVSLKVRIEIDREPVLAQKFLTEKAKQRPSNRSEKGVRCRTINDHLADCFLRILLKISWQQR